MHQFTVKFALLLLFTLSAVNARPIPNAVGKELVHDGSFSVDGFPVSVTGGIVNAGHNDDEDSGEENEEVKDEAEVENGAETIGDDDNHGNCNEVVQCVKVEVVVVDQQVEAVEDDVECILNDAEVKSEEKSEEQDANQNIEEDRKDESESDEEEENDKERSKDAQNGVEGDDDEKNNEEVDDGEESGKDDSDEEGSDEDEDSDEEEESDEEEDNDKSEDKAENKLETDCLQENNRGNEYAPNIHLQSLPGLYIQF